MKWSFSAVADTHDAVLGAVKDASVKVVDDLNLHIRDGNKQRANNNQASLPEIKHEEYMPNADAVAQAAAGIAAQIPETPGKKIAINVLGEIITTIVLISATEVREVVTAAHAIVRVDLIPA